MVTNEVLQEILQGKRPAFILIIDEKIQHWRSDQGLGIVIATSIEAARVLAKHFEKQTGTWAYIVEAGTKPGETLLGQIATSVGKGGADGIFVTEDGITNTYFKAPPVSSGA